MSERLSIAAITVQAHGLNPNTTAVVYDGAFTKPDEVYPTPDGDAYLSVAGLVASQEDGITITAQTPPGYLEHMREIEVLPASTKVIQRPITITEPGKVGYPASDPLALLVREGYRFDRDGSGKPRYVSIFESPRVREQARAAGLELLGRPDSTLTNNKANLRMNAPRYGIDMLPGEVIATWEDLERFINMYEGQKAWTKVSIGSGGDLVRPIRELSAQAARKATAEMRSAVSQAFQKGEFSMNLEEFWPEGTAAPIRFPSVIEIDANLEGEILANGSNAFTTKEDGTVDYLGTFQQITSSDGEFMGSRLYKPSGEILDAILDQTKRVANYNMQENRYFGVQGMDFFVMRDHQGRIRIRPIEINSRPPVSSYPEILMRNLRASEEGYESPEATWDNINLVSERPMDSDTKIVDLLGNDLAFGHRGHGGLVLRQAIPIAVRALVYINGHGEPSRVVPSDRIKMFVFGADPEQKSIAFNELAARGIIYKG